MQERIPLDLVIASHNQGKIEEFKWFFSGVRSAAEFGVGEIEESGQTFIENATLKAKRTMSVAQRPSLGDDSGLVVNGLNGDPGIYSARWARREGSFAKAMETIHRRLGDSVDRSAEFVCALCLAWPDGRSETVQESVAGWLVWPPRGDKGFGYDPFFRPIDSPHTFGELDWTQKNAISHRSRAIRALIEKVTR